MNQMNDTFCYSCGTAIEWQKDFDRPYPVNADGFLHRCAPQYTLASRLIEEAQLQRETYPQSHRTRAAAELLTEAAQALKGNDHGVSV